MIALPRFRFDPRGSIYQVDAAALVRWIRYWRPLRVNTDDEAGFTHPWEISAAWNAAQGRWEMQVAPGYVASGRGRVVREVLAPELPIDELPEATLDRLARDRSLADQIALESARPWLSEAPWFPCPEFRAVGTDAVASRELEPVPEYFSELGVVDGQTIAVEGETIRIKQPYEQVPPDQRRLLRAVDVVLAQPRQAPRFQADETTGGLRLDLDFPAGRDPRVRVQTEAYRPPNPVEGGTVEQAIASLIDPGLDELVIGRLWLVSPPGTPAGAPVDETWSPHPENFVFWNLNHDVDVSVDSFQPLELPGIASSLAGGIIDNILRQIEADDAAILSQIANIRVEGAFWT